MSETVLIDFELELIPWLREQLAADLADPGMTPRTRDEVESKEHQIGLCEMVLGGTGWKGHAQLQLRWMTYPYRERPGFDPQWRQWP